MGWVLIGDLATQTEVGAGPGTFRHTQTSPAATWTMTHNLGRYVEPTIVLTDRPGVPVTTDVEFPDADTCIATFDQPVTGVADF